jgi:membrane glycosyltransferase
MQYWHFLLIPGLKLVSRYQLIFAILMFLGSPAWMALLVLGTAALALTGSPDAFMRADAGFAVFVLVLVMWFAPKIATIIDVLARPSLRQSFGGGLRFLAGVVVETIFTLMLLPIMWFGHTMFLIRLLTGRKVGWTAQARDDHQVPWAIATRQLWPQTVLGWAVLLVLGATVPTAIPYALFIAGGLALSIPLAIATTMPAAGPAMVRIGLCQLPEETAPPPELAALALPAIEAAAHRRKA